MRHKNSSALRKPSENFQPQTPELQFKKKRLFFLELFKS